MTISTETLRAIAQASPFLDMSISEDLNAHREHVRRMDAAGMMEFLTNGRVFDDAGVRDMMHPVPDFTINREQHFHEGLPGRYFLNMDVRRSADASKAADAAIDRVAREDPEVAQDYQQVVEAVGSKGLFEHIAAQVRMFDLAQVAAQCRPDASEELSSVDDAVKRHSQRRMM